MDGLGEKCKFQQLVAMPDKGRVEECQKRFRDPRH
jgi:hypothetical protein